MNVAPFSLLMPCYICYKEAKERLLKMHNYIRWSCTYHPVYVLVLPVMLPVYTSGCITRFYTPIAALLVRYLPHMIHSHASSSAILIPI